MIEPKYIAIDDTSPLFNRKEMFYKEFPSDFQQIRYFTLLVVQKAPAVIRELNLLEQQISEVIKNAVKHGNESDPEKMVKIWYRFTEEEAHIIVEDEGPGFQDIEKWNRFNRERYECLSTEDYERMVNFVSYRTQQSRPEDGGNALFAAVEFWNEGFVFTSKKNCVAAKRKYPQNHLVRDNSAEA